MHWSLLKHWARTTLSRVQVGVTARAAMILLAMVPLLGAAVGCGRETDSGKANAAASDRAVLATPQRVIALAPSAVEMVCALGWCDQLVGVGSYATYPPQITELPKLGGLVDADLEQLLALQPDLVILLKSEEELAAKLAKLEVEVLTIPSDSLEDIQIAAQSITRRLGVPEQGVAWSRGLEQSLAPITRTDAPVVLLAVGRGPGKIASFLVPGEDTYLGVLVQRAGGVVAVQGFGHHYRDVGLDTALATRPDVILEFGFDDQVDRGLLLDDWRGIYPSASPMPCHQVIAGSHVPVPGPRVVELYADIVAALAACAA